MPCTIVVGGQWGDEAKGKFASYLAVTDNCSICCRAGLGPGAGHTVIFQGREYRLRQIPSGFINPTARLLLGAGILINPEVVLKEISDYNLEGRVGIDFRASIIEPEHIQRDKQNEHLARVIQSTGSGHGPALADRALRVSKLAKDIEQLRPYLTDVPQELNNVLDRGESVVIEGTNGHLLSVLYGTYPHTVAKDSTASTAAADVGLGPLRIDEVVLVFKTFPTRVGEGAFPTEMREEESDRRGFIEYGTVTGRRRRVGTFDFELAKQAVTINYPSLLAISFLDRIDPDCRGKSYEELNTQARQFLEEVEATLGTPIKLIGTGPDTADILDLRKVR
ncbi:MAG: adenylosuccinate synthetase [Chloroflexaceae bacterium]|nr:adenylosuccinate synthetase [Chloroflexaceae bacterium]